MPIREDSEETLDRFHKVVNIVKGGNTDGVTERNPEQVRAFVEHLALVFTDWGFPRMPSRSSSRMSIPTSRCFPGRRTYR